MRKNALSQCFIQVVQDLQAPDQQAMTFAVLGALNIVGIIRCAPHAFDVDGSQFGDCLCLVRLRNFDSGRVKHRCLLHGGLPGSFVMLITIRISFRYASAAGHGCTP